jgi:hypothetical protein
MAAPNELSQDVFGTPIADPTTLNPTNSQKALVRGTITAVSGTGSSALVTVTVDKGGAPGDQTITVVVGPKQLSVVPSM